jgi:tRNA G18 (ribose-2'-O)-methylase SpoU
VLEITQFGSTRSINASAAAAITMHEWVMQHVFTARKG